MKEKKIFTAIIPKTNLAELTCILLVLTLSSCVSARQAITESWADKYRAIEISDPDLYMNTIGEADTYYRNESYGWFWYMANNNFEDLSFTITGMDRVNPSSVLVHINQKHTYAGENFDFNYTVVYGLEEGGWRDQDLDFLVREIPGFRIYYMADEKHLAAFEGFLIKSNRDLIEVFGVGADDNFPVKLYTDRELLRQRTYPIIERQFTAWGEANESLKVYTGFPNIVMYEATVRHELVHHITLKMSSNRLCSWYAEGLAVNYGNSAIHGGDFVMTGRITKKDAQRTIAMLEAVNPATETNEREVACYYGVSGLIVKYIAETWGDEAHRKILFRCGEGGYFDRAKEKDPEAILQPILHEAFEYVLGITAEELSEGYLVWLNNTH